MLIYIIINIIINISAIFIIYFICINNNKEIINILKKDIIDDDNDNVNDSEIEKILTAIETNNY